MYKILFAAGCLSMFILQSCTQKAPKPEVAAEKPKPVRYLKTHDRHPADSLKLYVEGPFEESLELYADTDTLEKTVPKTVHMCIFKVEGQKFAVITEKTGTYFYKFENGAYNRIIKLVTPINEYVRPLKYKDLNGDGHKDVQYSPQALGHYGIDDYLLFYDPETQSLVCSQKLPMRAIKIEGNKVISEEPAWRDTYTITGNRLVLTEKIVHRSNGKVVSTFKEDGTLIKTVTLPRER